MLGADHLTIQTFLFKKDLEDSLQYLDLGNIIPLISTLRPAMDTLTSIQRCSSRKYIHLSEQRSKELEDLLFSLSSFMKQNSKIWNYLELNTRVKCKKSLSLFKSRFGDGLALSDSFGKIISSTLHEMSEKNIFNLPSIDYGIQSP